MATQALSHLASLSYKRRMIISTHIARRAWVKNTIESWTRFMACVLIRCHHRSCFFMFVNERDKTEKQTKRMGRRRGKREGQKKGKSKRKFVIGMLRERKRDRQTHRQTGRDTERATETERYRKRKKESGRKRDRLTKSVLCVKENGAGRNRENGKER